MFLFSKSKRKDVGLGVVYDLQAVSQLSMLSPYVGLSAVLLESCRCAHVLNGAPVLRMLSCCKATFHPS